VAERIDLVIVGCGVAGAAVACAAAERSEERGEPLRIVVLERAPASERGGNSRWTAAYLRMTDLDTPAPGFVEDLVGNGGGMIDRAYAQHLADQAGPTLRWLEHKGIEFGELPTIFLTQSRPRLLPVGGGRIVLDTLLADAERRGVELAYESTLQRIVRGGDGAVTVVAVSGIDGDVIEADVGAVVLAAGGFEGSETMMLEHIGAFPRTVAPGGGYNQGEAISAALAVGGGATGQWDLFHAEPVDPRSSRPEAVVMIFPYALLVDSNGDRFLDEGVGTIDEQYEAMARAVLALPDHRAWIVADQQVFDLPRWDEIVHSTVPPITAPTIAALATAMGVPEDQLERTVGEYNAAVEPGDFDPTRPDGKRAITVTPAKSNWARRLEHPPFLAWPQECSNVFTFGGLATDLDARVIDATGTEIPGLYAAGEITGLYHGKYTGATSVLRGLVFGRIAGRHAVDHVIASRSTGAPPTSAVNMSRQHEPST
jgi:tricarballylate dehydrogenase